MARDTAEYKYRVARDALSDRRDEGLITEEDHDLILEFINANDPDRKGSTPDGKTKSINTLSGYVYRLMRAAERLGADGYDPGPDAGRTLSEATTADVNALMQAYLTGDHPAIKEGGLARSSIKQHQGTIRNFYRYHAGNLHGASEAPESRTSPVDPDEIIMFQYERGKVRERDIYTREEIEDMREAIDNPRDRCLFELLVNTGQRITALQTLRIKDIDLGNDCLYLNEEKEGKGLKGADGKRPLLGAKPAVAEWLDYHPCPDDSEACLITSLRSYTGDQYGSEFGDPLSRPHIHRRLEAIGERAGVTKPLNPHNFRHSFVTIAKRHYDLPDDTIKFMLGHAKGSKVMETTYSHLTDEDHLERMNVATGLKEPEDEPAPLTPDICPTCSAQLDAQDKACSRCGTVFAPDSKAVQEAKERTEDTRREAASEGDAEATMTAEKLTQAIEENPEAVAEALKDADL